MPAVESWKVVVLTLFQKINKSYLRKYLKKLEEEDKWKCLNCDPSPLREQRAHFWAITRFHKVSALQVLTMFSFALSTFSRQEKLSAKIGKLPAASPSTPATPKKNSKVYFCREKLVCAAIYISIISNKKAGGAGTVINGSPILNGKSLNFSLGKSTATTLAGTKPLPALQKMAAIASTVASLQVRSVKIGKR